MSDQSLGDSLISRLECGDTQNLHADFESYLKPFTTNLQNTTTLRALASKYLPFLNRSLSLLKRMLSQTQTQIQPPFDTFRLCLSSLQSLSSHLQCKPHALHIYRIVLIHSLDRYKLYSQACSESLDLLRALTLLKVSNLGPPTYLPKLESGTDPEFIALVVEVFLSVVKYPTLLKSHAGDDYWRVLDLLNESRPWFGVLDVKSHEKFHRILVTRLHSCFLFLVGDLLQFDKDLIIRFCSETLNEYKTSLLKDQTLKFARQVCSCLFSQLDSDHVHKIGVLICLMDSIGNGCKAGDNSPMEFIELVSYCASRCLAVNADLCKAVAAHLNRVADDFFRGLAPFGMIVKLYACGISLISYNADDRGSDSTCVRSLIDKSAMTKFLNNGDVLKDISTLTFELGRYFNISSQEKSMSPSLANEGSICSIHPPITSNHDAAVVTQKNRHDYVYCYLTTLQFLCHPLCKFVNSETKWIVEEDADDSFFTQLYYIQDTFHQFYDSFICYYRCTSKGKSDGLDISKIVPNVAVAAYNLSIRTKHNMQRSVNFIKYTISSEWIQPEGLKILFRSLYNTGVELYRKNKLNEASKALKLCCRASWAHVKILCLVLVDKSNGLDKDFSEASVVDTINDLCTKSAFVLDVMFERNSSKPIKMIVESLKNWLAARKLCKNVHIPVALVRRWVKINCKLYKNFDVEGSNPTLYCLMSPLGISKTSLGIILEQELQAYKENSSICPNHCQRMQMKIIGILLNDVYIKDDTYFQKSKVLIRKAEVLRSHGVEAVKDCIQCLSEAISTILTHRKDIHGQTNIHNIGVSQHLGVAYCLRALCEQEAEPNSKLVFQDIQAVLDLWLSQHVLGDYFADNQCQMFSENTMLLLYQIIDLLSLKGCTKFHFDIYKLIIRLFQYKNVPPEKFLALLWKYRRLSHALCASPINEAFILNLSEHYGENLKSMDFWLTCMEESEPLIVGFQQKILSFYTVTEGSSHSSSFLSEISINEVKKAALDLISSVPVSSHSIFSASYLYHDMAERLICNGRLIEALMYAKEAFQLRSKLLQENFTYEFQNQTYEECEYSKRSFGLRDLQISSLVATRVWSFENISLESESCVLTPWGILECYLESTLQVGILHEIIGNESAAKVHLLLGKNISVAQDLPLFIVSFSSVLGKLYRKKQMWDLAEKELCSARKILIDDSATISCSKCRVIFDVSIDQELGNLCRSRCKSSNECSVLKSISDAENLYKCAIDKLNLSEWKNSINCSEESNIEGLILAKNHVCACSKTSSKTSQAKTEARKNKKGTKMSKKTGMQGQGLVPVDNMRITRSRYRSSQVQGSDIPLPLGAQNGLTEPTNAIHACYCSKTSTDDVILPEINRSFSDFGYKGACICMNRKCWRCLPLQVIKSGSMINFIQLKWEFIRRRAILRVLISLGKCLGNRGEIHGMHEIFVQSISVLFNINSVCHVSSSVPLTFFLDLVGKEIPGDMLLIERSEILYAICWFSFKEYNSQDTRIDCCVISHIQLQRMVSWLMLAFKLCWEVPLIFQKVSRLLSVIIVYSGSHDLSLLSLPSCEGLSINHWASYFHQASVGTHLNYQLISSMTMKHKSLSLVDAKDSRVAGTKTCNALRYAPESFKDLEEFVATFFKALPRTSIICISLFGDSYCTLLKKMIHCSSSVSAWMLISRLNSKNQPIVVLLPVDSILEDEGSTLWLESSDKAKTVDKHWNCPWGSTTVDDVAPIFKLILQENYLSSSNIPYEDTKRNRLVWWTQRKQLDQRLGKMLRDMEDSWFGPWKCLLLGELLDSIHLDSVNKKLVHDLKSKCRVDVNESTVKVVLGGGISVLENQECVSELFLKNGCCIGGGQTIHDTSKRFNLCEVAFKLILDAANDLVKEEILSREPVILVLDFEVQMLPWESIPILRDQEIYRMPSIGSISSTIDRSIQCPEKLLIEPDLIPLIDPLDAFYLLNPSGDLNGTQVEFENWFRNYKLEGNEGNVPTSGELSRSLESHDLFIYLGHGSGSQYIPGHEILKLENCCATLLMGCSSGSLSGSGIYPPRGTPLYYLAAGSPAVVANLWEVTDKDIDRFAKSMLDGLMRERSKCCIKCDKCESVVEQFKSLSISSGGGSERNLKESAPDPKLVEEACNYIDSKRFCNHRPKMGLFMSKAREACTLPFLIGAAPVCYGIPTGIWRKHKDS